MGKKVKKILKKVAPIVSVAAMFVPGLQTFAAGFNLATGVATGNPLQAIGGAFGLSGAFGGASGATGGGWAGGGGLEWSGAAPGVDLASGAFGGAAPSIISTGGGFYDYGGSGFDVGGAEGIGGSSGFQLSDGGYLSGDLSGLGGQNFDATGALTDVTDTLGNIFQNQNTILPNMDTGVVPTLSGAEAGGAIPGISGDISAIGAPPTGYDLPDMAGGTPGDLDFGGVSLESGGTSTPSSSLDTGGYSGGADIMNTPEPGWASPTQVSTNVPEGGGYSFGQDIFGQLKDKVGNMGARDWLKVGGGLYGMYNENQQLKQLQDMAKKSAAMADPFSAQRPQYQQLLSQSYSPEGLQGLFNREYMGGAGGQLMDQLQARDAAAGRRSQYAPRMAQLQSDFMNRYLPQYRQGLGNPSGANFGPGNASASYMAGMIPSIANRGRAAAGLMGTLSDIFGRA